MTTRITDQFARNQDRGIGGLLPYFTSGFPGLSAVSKLIRCADKLGVSVVEIGEPYSDSIADGPVIQESFYHALEGGHRVTDTFAMVSNLRADVSCALVSMVSFSIVHRFGQDRYFEEARRAGFDGVILPDVPLEESEQTNEKARAAELDYIGLISPTTSSERRKSIALSSSGFIYLVADTGTTGERAATATGLADRVGELRELTSLPICVGFGVASAEQVRQVCQIADGAIVGSAIIRRIADRLHAGASEDQIVTELRGFIGELMTGATGA